MADLTPKFFFEEKIARKLAERPDLSKAVNGVYQFVIEGEDGGTWIVDLCKEPGVVSAGPSEAAKCTVTAKSSDFVDIVSRKINAQMAFLTGKLRVKGDMGLAIKLTKVIG
jgi:putative sterol carrier protein